MRQLLLREMKVIEQAACAYEREHHSSGEVMPGMREHSGKEIAAQ